MNNIRNRGKYASKKWAVRKRKMFAGAVIGIAALWTFNIIQYVRLYDTIQEPLINAVEAQEGGELSIYEQICLASGGENCDVLYNLAKCESSLNPDAINWNTNRSVDLGIMQINTVHKDISNSDKFNLTKSVQWANQKIKEGKGSIWVCWGKI